MSRAARTLFPAAVAGLALAGCGGQSADGTHAAQTLTRAFHALAAGDGATVCALATAAGQRSLAAAVPGSDCAKVVDLVSAHLTAAQKTALATVKVGPVNVHGSQASVRTRDISSRRGSLRGFLVKNSAPTRLRKQSDGSWRIEG